MTRRLKLLLASGTGLVLLTAIACLVAIRLAAFDLPPSHEYSWDSGPPQREPMVQLGVDTPTFGIAQAIRIDLHQTAPYTRAGEPIRDVKTYIDTELERAPREWVIVSASPEVKFGDVVRVVDQCRQSRIHSIVLNYFPPPPAL